MWPTRPMSTRRRPVPVSVKSRADDDGAAAIEMDLFSQGIDVMDEQPRSRGQTPVQGTAAEDDEEQLGLLQETSVRAHCSLHTVMFVCFCMNCVMLGFLEGTFVQPFLFWPFLRSLNRPVYSLCKCFIAASNLHAVYVSVLVSFHGMAFPTSFASTTTAFKRFEVVFGSNSTVVNHISFVKLFTFNCSRMFFLRLQPSNDRTTKGRPRSASRSHAAGIDDEPDSLRSTAVRVCTIFGVIAVLAVLIGAFVFGIEPAPVRTRGELLVRSCHLPPRRHNGLGAESDSIGDRLLPWPARAFVQPNSLSPYLLAPVLDFRLSAHGFAMHPDVMALLSQRIGDLCTLLNVMIKDDVSANDVDVSSSVVISTVVLTVSSWFGNTTSRLPTSPWLRVGGFQPGPIPQHPMYEAYSLVANIGDGDNRKQRAAASVPHRQLSDDMLSHAMAVGQVNISSSSEWGVLRYGRFCLACSHI